MPNSTVIAILLAAVSLVVAIGTARWSLYIVDEQIRLRNNISELENSMDQVHIQYEFWLEQLQKERAEYLGDGSGPR